MSMMSRTASSMFRTVSWRAPVAAVVIGLGLAACARTVPIRVVVSPVDVHACRKLGDVGLTRTDGTERRAFVRGPGPTLVDARTGEVPPPITRSEIAGPNFGVTLDVMRESAYVLGATDLLLTRRIYHDWSYVSGTAYRCSQ